jgi:hypothetical protein
LNGSASLSPLARFQTAFRSIKLADCIQSYFRRGYYLANPTIARLSARAESQRECDTTMWTTISFVHFTPPQWDAYAFAQLLINVTCLLGRNILHLTVNRTIRSATIHSWALQPLPSHPGYAIKICILLFGPILLISVTSSPSPIWIFCEYSTSLSRLLTNAFHAIPFLCQIISTSDGKWVSPVLFIEHQPLCIHDKQCYKVSLTLSIQAPSALKLAMLVEYISMDCGHHRENMHRHSFIKSNRATFLILWVWRHSSLLSGTNLFTPIGSVEAYVVTRLAASPNDLGTIVMVSDQLLLANMSNFFTYMSCLLVVFIHDLPAQLLQATNWIWFEQQLSLRSIEISYSPPCEIRDFAQKNMLYWYSMTWFLDRIRTQIFRMCLCVFTHNVDLGRQTITQQLVIQSNPCITGSGSSQMKTSHNDVSYLTRPQSSRFLYLKEVYGISLTVNLGATLSHSCFRRLLLNYYNTFTQFRYSLVFYIRSRDFSEFISPQSCLSMNSIVGLHQSFAVHNSHWLEVLMVYLFVDLTTFLMRCNATDPSIVIGPVILDFITDKALSCLCVLLLIMEFMLCNLSTISSNNIVKSLRGSVKRHQVSLSLLLRSSRKVRCCSLFLRVLRTTSQRIAHHLKDRLWSSGLSVNQIIIQ